MQRKPPYRAPGIPEADWFTGTVKCAECGMVAGGVRTPPEHANFVWRQDTHDFICWICAHPDAERCEDKR